MHPIFSRRRAGVLLPVFSLAGSDGIGDFGGAFAFIDFLAKSGQTLWQILPLTIPDSLGSPYNSLSVFAGNWLYIHGDWGWGKGPPVVARSGPSEEVDYKTVWQQKERRLRGLYKKFKEESDPSLEDQFGEFVKTNKSWLTDFALFVTLKNHFEGLSWYRWPQPLRDRRPEAIADEKGRLGEEIGYQQFCQWLFWKQWSAVKKYANSKGILIIGDLPFFCTLDSCDVWSNQRFFLLDKSKRPLFRAGTPPDYFKKSGQYWGYPQYDWEALERDNFSWWHQRFRRVLSLYDAVRLDHFRGYVSLWYIPKGKRTGRKGKWVKVPGEKIFSDLLEPGPLPFIAEDLGSAVNEEVTGLRDSLAIPGMRVLLFGFSGTRDNSHRLENIVMNCVLYTGTHDNNTTRGFILAAKKTIRHRALAVTGSKTSNFATKLIEMGMSSQANTFIVPLVDILNLGKEARLNTPGKKKGNWGWRMDNNCLTSALAEEIRQLVITGARR